MNKEFVMTPGRIIGFEAETKGIINDNFSNYRCVYLRRNG